MCVGGGWEGGGEERLHAPIQYLFFCLSPKKSTAMLCQDPSNRIDVHVLFVLEMKNPSYSKITKD